MEKLVGREGEVEVGRELCMGFRQKEELMREGEFKGRVKSQKLNQHQTK